MNSELFINQSINMADGSINSITNADWQKPTPCSEWDLKALLKHMVYELVWIPDLLAGKTVAEVGDKYEGDILGSDPVGAWSAAAAAARDAVLSTDPDSTVHLSMGDALAVEYINEVAADILIHGWDVAKSLDLPYEISDELLDNLDLLLPVLNKKYGQYNVFGTPITVDDSAPRQVKLLASLGREV